MLKRWMMGMVLMLCAGLVMNPTRAQEQVEVITLNYRTAAEIIPIVQPLLGNDGAVTGMQNKLIVRTSAARLAQIKEVIASLDTRPRRLMVTVRQHTTREALAQEAGVYGTVGGAHGLVSLPEPPGRADARIEAGDDEARIGAKVTSTRGTESGADVQQVQVLEGNSAFIRMGQAVPYRDRSVYRGPRGETVVEDTTRYQDVSSGFYVTPRVSGDQVTLDISPPRNTPGTRGTVNVQQAATTLSGRLGEWIELGGIGQQLEQQGGGVTYSTRRSQAENYSTFVKVEEIK